MFFSRTRSPSSYYISEEGPLGALEEKRTSLRRNAEADHRRDAVLQLRFSRALAQGVVGSAPRREPREGVCDRSAKMLEDESHAEGAAVVAAAGEALQALCQELNLDEGSAAEALDDFTAIRGNYSLEVSGGRWAFGSHPRQAPPRLRPHPHPSLWGGGSFPTRKGRRPAGRRRARNWKEGRV